MALKFGNPPFLECSSKGEVRFSTFYARLRCYQNRSIEEIYQSAKIFEDGLTSLGWRDAKGRYPINLREVNNLYRRLWRIYISENPHLLRLLLEATGLSDMFGQIGHCCQAEELWIIRKRLLKVPDIEKWIAQRRTIFPKRGKNTPKS